MSQANLALGLDFKKDNDARKKSDIANLIQQIQTVQGLENQNYNRNRTTANDIATNFGRYVDPNTLNPLSESEMATAMPYQDDYQKAINLFGANSAMGQILARARTQKILSDMQKYGQYLPQTKEAFEKDQQKEIDTVGQYYGDYQAEIDRRTNTPDTADDYLIPYLRMAREGKIEALDKKKIEADKVKFEQNYKKDN